MLVVMNPALRVLQLPAAPVIRVCVRSWTAGN